MTYTTPELLLVGAAQNLVLETSPPLPGFSDGVHCDRINEPDPDEYQALASW